MSSAALLAAFVSGAEPSCPDLGGCLQRCLSEEDGGGPGGGGGGGGGSAAVQAGFTKSFKE